MDGTALYQVVAAVFIAQMFGVQMEPATLALLIVTVVGASIGSPSTPGWASSFSPPCWAGWAFPPRGGDSAGRGPAAGYEPHGAQCHR